MLIDIQLGQCTDIDLKFIFSWQRIGQFVVQSMDTLDHQDISTLQLLDITLVLSLTGLEIEGWQLYLFAVKELS